MAETGRHQDRRVGPVTSVKRSRWRIGSWTLREKPALPRMIVAESGLLLAAGVSEKGVFVTRDRNAARPRRPSFPPCEGGAGVGVVSQPLPRQVFPPVGRRSAAAAPAPTPLGCACPPHRWLPTQAPHPAFGHLLPVGEGGKELPRRELCPNNNGKKSCGPMGWCTSPLALPSRGLKSAKPLVVCEKSW